MKRFLFPLLIVPISLFAEGGLPDKPYIYVEGDAEVQKPADVVTLRFDVVGRAPDQPKANQDVQTKANKIFELVKNAKVADNDVIADDLRSEPELEQNESYSRGHGKLIGYKVTRPFQIKVRDLTSFPKLVDELLNLEGTEFSGIEGGLQKQNEIENEIGDKALANARERAEKTLKQMNMKIDSVFAISPVAFPEIESRMFVQESVTYLGVRAAKVGLPVSSAAQYQVAPVKLTESVHVIYLISPAK
ncbi:MAG TPA: SIMPL domain-containing protein [Chthoniobacterales bacterium]|nr:SIMPL domain-containing protein [Chthoniobacterales bacterium]